MIRITIYAAGKVGRVDSLSVPGKNALCGCKIQIRSLSSAANAADPMRRRRVYKVDVVGFIKRVVV